MMLWLICLFIVAAHFTQLLWKATLEREIRWALYRVRDELRWAVIQKPELLNDRRFWELDDALTLRCRYLHTLAIWPMLVISKCMDERELSSLNANSGTSLGPFQRFYDEAARLTLQHLRNRHMFLGRVGLNWMLAHLSNAPTRLDTAADYLVMRTPHGSEAGRNGDWTLRSRVKAA